MTLAALRPRLAAALCAAIAAAGAGACGKKGAPLPPFAKAPVAPPEFSARRQGDRVVVTFVVPQADLDGRRPANIDRVEIYAMTSDTAPIDYFEKYAEVVEQVLVKPPPPPPPDVEEGQPPPPPPPPVTDPGLPQGAPAQVIDQLGPEDLTPLTIPEVEEAREEEEERRARQAREIEPPLLTPPDLGPPIPEPPRRFYVARGRNGRRKGGWSPRVPVSIGPAPLAPSAPAAAVADGRLELTWTPPSGLKAPIQRPTMAAPTPPRPGAPSGPGATPPPTPEDEPEGAPPAPAATPAPAPVAPPSDAGPPVAAPTETEPPAVPEGVAPGSSPVTVLPSRLLTAWPVTTTGYVVDEVAPTSFDAPALEPGAVPPYPKRLTPTPLVVPSHQLTGVVYGVERCFAVRTVETAGTMIVESEASPTTCVTPVDTFAPPPPTELAAVASEGAISLIWEPSPAADLAGYLVLRGEAGADTLAPLTDQPLRDTTYRDTTVTPGIRYVYAVVAVDNARPPNTSAPSNRVEETAR